MERWVPDAVTTSIILLVLVFFLTLAIGTPLSTVFDAYYRGLWSLLSFAMQMTLILVVSLVVAASPFFRRIVVAASRVPRTTLQVVVGASLCTALIAYCNWGLGVALAPMIAIHFARQAELKGLPVDFLFLQAILAGAGSIWQFGLSASAPLLVATPGHFLEEQVGILRLATTIWAPATLVHVPVFLGATMVVGYLLMPKKPRLLSEFPASEELAKESPPRASVERAARGGDLAQGLENSRLTLLPLQIALGAWLYLHFFVKDLSLDINAVITILLLAAFVLHGTVARFTAALQGAISAGWPIVVMYHLYAGVAGLIQYTPLGEFLADVISPISTPLTFPLLTAIISTLVAVFIPTSGGQWVIQGFITVRAAEAIGLTAQRGLLSLGIGDHMDNLISPFWAVVGANIAKVDFRLLFGYRLIFAALWFGIGVVVFTLLPC
ncbi:MAG TPA: TIGR00366 family protein [Thermoanaerobaculia bacterium]|nr:TIGR00366 family protein [Thermoanaerobaculia bacterium]